MTPQASKHKHRPTVQTSSAQLLEDTDMLKESAPICPDPCRDSPNRQMVMFWPLSSRSGLLKGHGTLNSPLHVPCRSAATKETSLMVQKSILIQLYMLTELTACISFGRFMLETGFMASSVLLNTMSSITCALQRKAVLFFHPPPFYPLKIIFRLLSNIFS